MRRLLGTLTLVLCLGLALSACGQESPSDAEADSPTSTDTPQSEPTIVRILSETAAGGEIGKSAIRIDRPAGMATLAREVETPAFATRIRRVVERNEVPAGEALYGQVIAVGCDVPPSATVSVEDGAVVITAAKILSPLPECFAPVTTVAIARVALPLS